MNLRELIVDEDITVAESLPSWFYTDEEVFELSKKAIFSRSWQPVGVLDRDSDKVHASRFMPGFIEEPLLLTVDDSGEMRCISNVCTHRGMLLCKEGETCCEIRCAYHGRKFEIDGRFKSMPEFTGAKNFPRPEDDLAKIPSATWGGFHFASLEPSDELEVFMKSVDLESFAYSFDELELAATKDYEVDAHWALYCENYLEGFHIPYVHRGLNREINYSEYETSADGFGVKQTATDNDKARCAEYCFVFPNLMFNLYPWGISVNIVRPVSVSKTVVSYLTFVFDESLVGLGAGGDLDTVELEDQAVVESVQKGIRSRYYDRGRYSPGRETGTHHFHRLIGNFMNS